MSEPFARAGYLERYSCILVFQERQNGKKMTLAIELLTNTSNGGNIITEYKEIGIQLVMQLFAVATDVTLITRRKCAERQL